MTPTALTYLVLGLSILFWPLATVLTRRRMLGAQWLLLAAMLMFGIAFILYSCLFNSFLRGEYLLLVLYMTFALFTPPVAVSATALLTRPDGATRLSRAAVIPAVVTAALMLASFFIGGADMYRLWVNRGTLGEADLFFANSWRYNVIVAIHYYLFSAILSVEILFLALYSIVHLRRYNRILAEYYTADLHRVVRHRTLYALILLISLVLVALTILYPLNTPRPLWVTVAQSSASNTPPPSSPTSHTPTTPMPSHASHTSAATTPPTHSKPPSKKSCTPPSTNPASFETTSSPIFPSMGNNV